VYENGCQFWQPFFHPTQHIYSATVENQGIAAMSKRPAIKAII
jgi:hypothetical protein